MKIKADIVYSLGKAKVGDSMKGVIRIIESGNDLAKVQRGDIAVAVALEADLPTVVDWVIFQSPAGAIITRTGGYAAHFAQIAREMGMPGMTIRGSAGDVFFDDGQRVTVKFSRRLGVVIAEIESIG